MNQNTSEQTEKRPKPEIDWIIHLCCNGAACAECGEVENGFLPFMCNAHTHGMGKYHHPDFQMVLNLPNSEIGRILNTFGSMAQSGRRFHDGEYVLGIYEDCSVRLMEFTECGRKVLRVVIPDKHNVYPENPACELPYSLQLLETDELYSKEGCDCNAGDQE